MERRRLIARGRFGAKDEVRTTGGLAITSHPLATRAATDILRAGGNSVDAALSASITQTVVEPHMTTITGMLSMLHFDAASGESTYCNGAVNAPLAPLPGFSAADIAGGRGIAVPGWWAGFEAALARFGSKPKREVMAAAIDYARTGFEVHPFLYGETFIHASHLGRTAQGREIFFPNGTLVEPGELLVQSRAADTLERLVDEGEDFFYRGDFGRELCEVAKRAGGVLTAEDLDRYRVRWMEPSRGSYRGYDLIGSPPPDTGGTHVIEILHILEQLDLERMGPPWESAETLWHLIAAHNEVTKAGERMHDPDSHPVPLGVVLSKDFAAMRLALIRMSSVIPTAAATPPGSNHVTVVDAAGNATTILHSCMSTPWSNGLFAGGVSVCAAGTHFLRTMPRPGQRSTCVVVPTMVMQKGSPVLVAGSPSMALIANVVQNTVHQLDFGDSIGQSVRRPRFGYFTASGEQDIESDFPEHVLAGLEHKGMKLNRLSPWYWLNGAYEGIRLDAVTGERSAAGDPRRTSVAEADS